MSKQLKEKGAYIPEIPEQIIEMDNSKEKIKEDSEEVKLLKKILYIQHSGGWGRHLDQIIYERLQKLENEQ